MNATGIAKTLKAKGQPMTLTRQGAGAFDPVTGGMTGGVTQTFTVYGITKNYNRFNMGSSFSDVNSLIQSGDKQALIASDVIEPVPTDVMTIMGVDWVVISVNTTSPQGVALLHSCQIRK